MPLSYLIDENLRGTLIVVVLRVATRYGLRLDVVQVGDEATPPRGKKDPELLEWAENEERILVSQDRRSMARHLENHLKRRRRSPGIFITGNKTLLEISEQLVLLAFASDPSEWENRIDFLS